MLTGIVGAVILVLLMTIFPMRSLGKDRPNWKLTVGISVALILACIAFVKGMA